VTVVNGDERTSLVVSDDRSATRRLLGRLEVRSWKRGAHAALCLALATLVAYVPSHAGLSHEGRHALFILVAAAGLWLTEAIPAFAVALVVMALEILLLGGLGRPGHKGVEYTRFLAPWASPLVWLFLGGFVLGHGAARTGLDRWLAERVIGVFGRTRRGLLFGLMLVGFTLSMFMSNTAAAAMLLAIAAPMREGLPKNDAMRRAIVLSVPVATNLGGMGSLIGSPPNAVAANAVNAVGGARTLDFARWMLVGLPPAVLLLGIAFWMLSRQVPLGESGGAVAAARRAAPPGTQLPNWRKLTVMVTFVVTVALWSTDSLHGIPTPVVSFLPITVLSAIGVLRAEDVRGLGWDVLLLLAGGLALGAAVQETGLATWLVSSLPVSSLSRITVALVLAYAVAVLSNLMSNTAAATILVPVAVELGRGYEPLAVVPIALAASAAMCLPISTPPNALAFSTGDLSSRDFLRPGIVLGLLAPVVAVAWCALVLR
jgi:solute carrier family 13 (sodium-dependent dicarboxylate transporter), member 2/3/5